LKSSDFSFKCASLELGVLKHNIFLNYGHH
jgi:hypothetical protein